LVQWSRQAFDIARFSDFPHEFSCSLAATVGDSSVSVDPRGMAHINRKNLWQ
jgi:hypothetical protein